MQQHYKLLLPGIILALAILVSPFASAQSGGNFVATANNTVCSVNSSNGNFTIGGMTFTQASGGSLTATIKLPNSSPGLLVTPSLVTGMYTNTLSSNTMPSETAAIVVAVTDSVSGFPTKTLTPNQTCVDTSAAGTTNCTPTSTDPNCHCGVAYDERFQQLTTTNFMTNESVDLILSTLSAHSFNFTEGAVPGGLHTINLNWYFGCDSGTGFLHTAQCGSAFTANSAAACAGPENLTVQQVQNFQQDKQGIGTTGP
jgi:hypothetical protein